MNQESEDIPLNGFKCPSCTFVNADIQQCAMCETPRGAVAGSLEEQESRHFNQEPMAKCGPVHVNKSMNQADRRKAEDDGLDTVAVDEDSFKNETERKEDENVPDMYISPDVKRRTSIPSQKLSSLEEGDTDSPSQDPQRQLFGAVIQKKPHNVLERWVNAGANVNAMSKQHVEAGRTPLCYAVNQNDFVTVQNLITLGADLNQKCEDGESALTIAIQNKAYDGTEMFRLLLSHGADHTHAQKYDLNISMKYWVEQAKLFPVTKEQIEILKPFDLQELARISYCVVGQRIAVRMLRRSVRNYALFD